MITMNAAETAVFTGADRRGAAHYLQVDVQDSNDVWQTWTNLDERDFIGGLDMRKTIREGYWQGTLNFVWHRYNDNLSPFGDTGGRYHDFARPWRKIRISIKVTPHGADTDDYTWRELVYGRTTVMDIAENPGTIGFIGKIYGEAQRTSFIDKMGFFGADPPDPDVDIEDAIQALINAYYDPTQPTPTLVVPVATSFQVRRWAQQKMPLAQAFMAIPPQIGWAIEERWQGSGWALELYEPDRTQTVPDFTFEPEQIASYGRYALEDDTIRNIVEVIFGSSTGKDQYDQPKRESVLRTATTSPAHTRLQDGASVVADSSIDKYGPRFMGMIEGSSSLVQLQAQAEALADAAIADLSDPVLFADVELPFVFWALELNDYYRFKADGKRSQADIDLAVQEVSFKVDASNGGKTQLRCKGKPGLPKSMWLAQEGRPGVNFPSNVDAPDSPEVDTFPVIGLGTVVTLAKIPQGWDYDQIIWHKSADPNFTPSPATRIHAGRETTLPLQHDGGRTFYYKAQIRDAQGNITGSSAQVSAYTEPVMVDNQPIPLIVDVTQIAAPTLDNAIPLLVDVTTGTSQVYSDERWCAPSDGAYTINATLTADATPSSGTLQLEWYSIDATAVVVTGVQNGAFGGTNGSQFSISGSFVADGGDCFELRMGGSGTVGTFDLDGSMSVTPVPGTQHVSRTNPDPVPRPTPTVQWSNGYSTSPFGGSRTNDVFDAESSQQLSQLLTASGFWNDNPGDNEGELQIWRSFDIFGGMINGRAGITRTAETDASEWRSCAWDAGNLTVYGAGFTRNDGASEYTFVDKWGTEQTPARVGTVSLTTGITPGDHVPTGMAVRSSDEKSWVALDYSGAGGTGRIFRINAAFSAIDETGPALDNLLDLVLVGDPGTIVTVAASDLYAYDPDDLTDQLWTVDITTVYSETFDRDEGGEIRAAQEGGAFYMAPGGGRDSAAGQSTLYKFETGAGALLWSKDLSSHTPLSAVDGVGPICVDESTGDVYAVVTDFNSTNPQWDILCLDKTGRFKGGMRGTFGLDPREKLKWSLGLNVFGGFREVPFRLGRVKDYLVCFFRTGVAVPFRAMTNAQPFQPHQAILDSSWHETFFEDDGHADGAAATGFTWRSVGNIEFPDVRMTQSTGANQATYRASGGSLGLPCLEFDGTNDFYTSVGNVGDLSAPLAIFALVEPRGEEQGSIVEIYSPDIGEDQPLFQLRHTGAGAPPISEGRCGTYQEVYGYEPGAVWADAGTPTLLGRGAADYFNDIRYGGSEWGYEAYYKERAADRAFTTASVSWVPPHHYWRCRTTAPTDEGSTGGSNASNIATPTASSSSIDHSWFSLDFDTAGDGLSIADNADFDYTGSNDRSWSIWVNLDSWASDQLVIQKEATDGWVLFWDDSADQFRLELTWNSGGSGSAATSPVVPAGAQAGWVHVAVTLSTSHAQVFVNGAPGTIQTVVGDTSNAAAVRIGATDASSPPGVNDMVGLVTEIGHWTSRLHPWAIWKMYREGLGASTALRLGATEVRAQNEVLVVGRTEPSKTNPYFDGFVYKIWAVNLFGGGTVGGLDLSQHAAVRKWLSSESKGGVLDVVNDHRFWENATAWAWYQFGEASGNFASTTDNYGPALTRTGTATSISAYQQTAPTILGAGGNTTIPEQYNYGYAVTLADNSEISVPTPSIYAWREIPWSVSWMHKWDTGSAHTNGHIWSIPLSGGTGIVRCYINATNDVVVVYDDGAGGGVTVTFDVGVDLQDGNWHGIALRFYEPDGSGLVDAECWHHSQPHWPKVETANAYDIDDYTDADAATIVFGAGAEVPAGEEFEGDIAQIVLNFGDSPFRRGW